MWDGRNWNGGWENSRRYPFTTSSVQGSEGICSHLWKQWATLPAGDSADCDSVLVGVSGELNWKVWSEDAGEADLSLSVVVAFVGSVACCTAEGGADSCCRTSQRHLFIKNDVHLFYHHSRLAYRKLAH